MKILHGPVPVFADERTRDAGGLGRCEPVSPDRVSSGNFVDQADTNWECGEGSQPGGNVKMMIGKAPVTGPNKKKIWADAAVEVALVLCKEMA